MAERRQRDWHNPGLVADITNVTAFPAGHFDVILAQDVLEHIDRTAQVSAVSGWARLLSQDGRMTVRVPGLFDLIALGSTADWQSEERQEYLIQMFYGTQAYPGDYHRCDYIPYTIATLANRTNLAVAGLTL